MADVTIRFRCGALVRRQVRRTLDRMLRDLPTEVRGDWWEDAGWVQSVFYVRFTGDSKLVNDWTQAVFDFAPP